MAWTWFFEPGPLTHDVGPPSDHAPNDGGGLVRLPDSRQVIGRQQLGQDAGVDPVCLDLGVRDGAGPHWVGDDDATGVLLEEPGHGEGVDGGLQGELIVWAQTLCKRPQLRGRGSNSSQLPHIAAGQSLGDLGEVFVDIQAQPTHPGPSFS
jgi:hypothetical protein